MPRDNEDPPIGDREDENPFVSEGVDASQDGAVNNAADNNLQGRLSTSNAAKKKVCEWAYKELREKGLVQFQQSAHLGPLLEECHIQERITAKDMVKNGFAVVIKPYDLKKPTEPGVYMLCNSTKMDIKPTSKIEAPKPKEAIVEVQEKERTKAKKTISARILEVRDQKQSHMSAMEKFSRAIAALQREVSLLELEEKHLLPFAEIEGVAEE